MLERFEALAEPPDESSTLWRFMDFTKYVAMLHRRSLFFARADEMPDPFEGRYGRRRQVDALGHHGARQLRKQVLLSCWHENEHESAAMWRIYLSAEDGIAIRTSFPRLCQALSATNEKIVAGKVRYVDERRPAPLSDLELAPFFCKRKSFEYEREVRLLCRAADADEQLGRYVAVDLQELIEQVVIAPTAESWLLDLVSSVTEKYGVTVPVAASTMLDCPDEPSAADEPSGDVDSPPDADTPAAGVSERDVHGMGFAPREGSQPGRPQHEPG